jgi:hypothetical protein
LRAAVLRSFCCVDVEMLDFLSLVLGLSLPWMFGVALLTVAYARAAPDASPPVAWVVGCGWFVGIFATTLLMRGVAAAGVPLSIASIGAPLLVATAVLAWLARRHADASVATMIRSVARALGGSGLEGWQRTAWRILVAWLALRFALLLAEVWWRPLYPWDAWTQWGTKARVWFELRSLVPFVTVSEWLSRTVPNGYIDAAPHYPATVPLFQVWAALLIGRWDDALVNLPWWMTGVAFSAAFHGALRRIGFAPIIAILGTAIVMSLPILNVHIALAGYADLPLAAYLTLGTLAALHAVRARSPVDAGLALVVLAASVLVKNPGKAWLIVLAPGILVAAMPRRGLQVAGVAFAAAALAILVAARSGVNILGYQLSPQFAMPWNALFDAYFSFGNWNLLWYCAVATTLLGWRELLSRDVAPLTCVIAGGLMFLFIGFAFTNAGAWVEDQSTVNRATLHLAPLIVVWVLVTLRAAHEARRERELALQPRPG